VDNKLKYKCESHVSNLKINRVYKTPY